MTKLSTLILDGDLDFRDTLCQFLGKNEAFHIFYANSPEEGLHIFQTEKADIVITDFAPLKSDGRLLIEHIKEVDVKVPMIVMPGSHLDDMSLDLFRFPRIIALHKPFDLALLPQAIDYVRDLPLPPSELLRRAAFRVEIELDATIHQHGKGKVKNISISGVFIETTGYFSMGQELSFTLHFSETLRLTGQVMWIRPLDNKTGPHSGIGIRFAHLHTIDEFRLKVYLAQEFRKRRIR